VTNTDRGSDQKIFKNFIINGTTLAAQSNEDSIEFAAGTGLSMSVSGNKIVVSASGGSSGDSGTTIINNTIVQGGGSSGFIDNGTTVSLSTSSDNVGIGKDAAEAKVDILNTSNQVALSVQAAPGQTADIAQFKKADGTSMITFDADGNANFNGTISQDGAEIKGSGIDFTGTGSTVSLNLVTDEPANLLSNPGVDTNLDQWSYDTPTATNQATNADFATSLTSWTGQLITGAYTENFVNPGVEANLLNWTFNGGGLYTETLFTGFTTSPWDVTTGPDGNLWIAPFGGANLVKMTTSGTITEYPLPSPRTMNQAITVGPDNNIWFPSQTGSVMIKSTTNGVMTAYAMGGISNYVTSGPDGNIWYTIAGKVGKMTTSGVRTEYSVTTSPAGIAAGPDGNMWYTTALGNKVGKIALDGTGNTEYSTGTATDCRKIKAATDGNLYIACWGTESIAKVSTTGTVTNLGTTGVLDPDGLAEDNSGNIWFVANSTTKIGRYTPGTGVTTEFTTTHVRHVGATIDTTGNLWFTDRNDGKMSKFVITGPSHVTSPTQSSSAGALYIPSNSQATTATQTINLGNTKTYSVSVYAYIDGTTPVTSTQAQLIVNGSGITTTYTSVGGGWYKLSGTFSGTNSSVAYGVQINSNQALYLDNFSLQIASPATHFVAPNYTALGSAQVDAPSFSDVTLLQTAPFIATPYNISAKVYTNGSAVTSADAQLYFNGAVVPTTISSTGTPGWYLLSGTFTPTEGSYGYGVIIKANKTAYVDNISLTVSDVSGSVSHSTAQPTYNSSAGAARMNAIGRSSIKFYQPVTITTSGTYSIFARVYNNTPGEIGGTINSSKAKLVINGTAMSGVSYTPVIGDFYQLGASTFLSAGTYSIGMSAESGYRLVADAFSVQLGSGTDKNIVITNSGSGLATLNVESTTTANSGSPDRQAIIIVGSPNQSANLVELRDSNSNVLSVFNSIGQLGLGTSTPSRNLVVIKDDSAKQPVAFINSTNVDAPSTGILKLALGVATSGIDSRFIQFYANATGESDGTGVGRIRLNNGGVAYESGGADFAEYFTADTTGYKAGEVVALNSDGKVSRTFKSYDQHALGVVSNTAAFVGNAPDDFEATQSAKITVGLIGQMDVKVSTLSGEIKKGDFITTSSIPGLAMKGSKRGLMLGIALDDFKPASESASINCPRGFDDITKCGEVRAYISPRWIDPTEDSEENILAALSDQTSAASVSASQIKDDLTVLEHTNLNDVSITGSFSVGLLDIQGVTEGGEAAINTLTGDLLLQSQAAGGIKMLNGRIEITKQGTITLNEGDIDVKQGVIKGNDKFVGIEKLPARQDSIQVHRNWEAQPTTIQVVPDYNTTIWVTDVNTKGFIIHVGTPRDQDSSLRWSVLFK
jgi:virginiamycin B lyase